MVAQFTEFLPAVIKPGSYEILKALKDGPKTWSDLEGIEDMNPAKLSRRLRELLQHGLVRIVIIHDRPTGTKAYSITDFGLKVLSKLEEIEKIYEQELAKAPLKTQLRKRVF